MIEIRNFEPNDTTVLRKLHEGSGFDYRFPTLSSPLFAVKRVGVSDEKVVIASVVKVEAEAYLWIDKEWGTPEERFEAVRQINADIREESAHIGFDQLYCVLPPEVASSFGPRLEEMGWLKSRPWPRFTMEIRR